MALDYTTKSGDTWDLIAILRAPLFAFVPFHILAELLVTFVHNGT